MDKKLKDLLGYTLAYGILAVAGIHAYFTAPDMVKDAVYGASIGWALCYVAINKFINSLYPRKENMAG